MEATLKASREIFLCHLKFFKENSLVKFLALLLLASLSFTKIL